MSSTYIEFDTTPVNEDCVQVDQNNEYIPAMKAEANRYKEMLEKRYPKAPGYFSVKKQYHDFGTYYEVCYHFNEDENGYAWSNLIEETLPQTWNDIQVIELNK